MYEEIRQAALALGARSAAVIKVSEIPFEAGFRKLCESNACGNFGGCYMCPPDVGEIDELIREAKRYRYAVVYQTVWDLEDSYDFEGMMLAGQRQNDLAQAVREIPMLRQAERTLHLGAGGCRVCPVCGKKTGQPCRHPELAMASLEAYGINVSELARLCGMRYINGENTVTYFGMVLIGRHAAFVEDAEREESMGRDMRQWMEELRTAPVKKALPVLSFPAVQLLGITVKELISDAGAQARGMEAVAKEVDAAASVSLMDLSVEAECFGSKIHISEDEVPTVVGSIIETQEQADALEIPKVGSGRTGLYIQAIGRAVKAITDRPVFAGVIGPFSLAGRLLDVTEVMILCYEDPDLVHTVLRKATEFLKVYSRAYKEAGAHGIVMAEPLAGILSPALAEEFSAPYVKEIVDAVQDDSFLVIYHNCGNNTVSMLDSILETGAAAYHFGNAVDMEDVLKKVPEETVVMGNIDPARQFRGGSPESVREATLELMERCCKYPNFVISSGCDIPPMSKWENIRAFFDAVDEFYQNASK